MRVHLWRAVSHSGYRWYFVLINSFISASAALSSFDSADSSPVRKGLILGIRKQTLCISYQRLIINHRFLSVNIE